MMHAQDAIDLVIGWVWGFVYQVLGSNDQAWSAESALQATAGDEAVRIYVSLARAESLESQNPFAVSRSRGHRARDYRSIVDDDRATTALALRRAPILWRDQTATVAKYFEQCGLRVDLDHSGLAVQI
jgi:hypothetical protein